MKRLLIAGLSTVALVGLVNPAQAETTATELVNLARQGYLTEQGVPAYARLNADVQSGQVTAEDVIQAAIAQNRVDAEALNNQQFVQSVRVELNDLSDR